MAVVVDDIVASLFLMLSLLELLILFVDSVALLFSMLSLLVLLLVVGVVNGDVGSDDVCRLSPPGCLESNHPNCWNAL